MGSEGYLVDQFLSPETNRREDAWGGDASGRMRFGVELAAAVREAVGPGFPVIFRMTGAELMPRVAALRGGRWSSRGRWSAPGSTRSTSASAGTNRRSRPCRARSRRGSGLPWAEAVKEAVGERRRR